MQGLNDLDLIRQHREELLREAENGRLARRLRLASAKESYRPSLLARVRDALRPAPKEANLGDC